MAIAEEFHVGIGGPLHRLERVSHIEKLGRLILVAIAVTWLPLVVLSLTHWWIAGRSEPMFKDLSIHVRFLITLPLLLSAERMLDRSCQAAVSRLFSEGFVPHVQEARARAVLSSAERWRDSRLPEGALLLAAISLGLASLAGLLPPAGVIHGVVESHYGLVRIWYALVSLPIFLFVLWRSLFRWGLWVRVLVGLSRVPLRLLPMHADRRGGIGFLKVPSIKYCGVLLLAVSAVLCAGWGTQVLLYGTKIDTLKPLFYAFVVIGALIALAPLLVFVPQLLESRRRGRAVFGALVTHYVSAFEARWIGRSARTDLLGNPDFQSLSDLSTSYRENVQKMQVLLFDARDIVLLYVVSLLPTIPVLLLQQPASHIVQKLLRVLAGGMPG